MSDTQPISPVPASTTGVSGTAGATDTLPPPPESTAVTPTDAPADAAPRTRWRDRLFGLRSLLAVAVAGVVLGGLGGWAVHATTDGGTTGGGPGGRFGQGPGGAGQGGPQGGFGGQPGQQQPGQQGQVPGQQGQPGQQPGGATGTQQDPSTTTS